MRAFHPDDAGYPEAALVFCPTIPPGSDVPAGNFKASVCELGAVGSLLTRPSGLQWPLARWRAFAENLRLTRVESIDAACDPSLVEAEAMIASWLSTTGLGAIALICSLAVAPATMARNGADDPAGHVRQGHGADDAPGHVRQCRGCDDSPGHVRQGRAAASVGSCIVRGCPSNFRSAMSKLWPVFVTPQPFEA